MRGATITLTLLGALGCSQAEVDPAARPLGLFELVTDGRIANDGGASRGVAWADFDDDGAPDLAVGNAGGQWNALYLNDSGQFTKLTDTGLSEWAEFAAAGGASQGVSWVDYDGDGDVDLHVANRDDQPGFLFENEGTGFRRVPSSPLIDAAGTSMACWADVDRDGWLDVFVTGYGGSPNRFFTGRDGVFTERVPHPLHFGAGAARACAWGDPNDDGLPDLYVGNARQPNQLFWNHGDLAFEEDRDAGHLVEHVGYSYGLSWADYDEDGDQDLFVANFDTRNVIYRNDGAGVLRPVADGSVVEEEGGASKGHAWGDYDLDGDVDLFVANGTYGPDMRNFVYLNEGDGRFVRDLGSVAAVHADTSAGAAWADFDLDGDLDVYVANWGSLDEPNRLYRNTTTETT
ncbi:MAG: VCBS repeat-containing protein, partial [Gemmatimonadota bacterium]|nr:VCBS repeat-containing protein [Gemmatimonadota bacterium]